MPDSTEFLAPRVNRGSSIAINGVRLVVLIALTAITALAAWLYFEGFSVTARLVSGDIRHELGNAYIGLANQATWPMTDRSDSEQAPAASELNLFEDGHRLGPPHSLHALIRTAGRGAYSDWNGYLLFSSSDNSNPQSNGRVYTVQRKLFVSTSGLLISSILLAAAMWLNRDTLTVVALPVMKISGLHWIVRNVLPGVAISVVMLVIVCGTGELIFRAQSPFLTVSWPIRFDSRYGFNFIPGSTVSWTNHLDYWASNHANSLGFLDREPPKNAYPDPGVCRIALIGDSFVEAAQVPLEEKMQVQLDRLGKESLPGKKFETVAFGISGTGQANQLPFYDVFARHLHPNVVVLVFVGNDFANNSSVLEAVRNGWSPLNAPRLFFRRSENGEISPLPIDPDFYLKELHVVEPVQNWRASIHETLIENSYFYNWVFARLSLGYPHAAQWLDGMPSTRKIYAARLQRIKRDWPQFDLSGWNYPDDWDMDKMFFARNLPPVFKDALAFTGKALDEFEDRARRDEFHLIILADKSAYLNGSGVSNGNPNPLQERGQIDRLEDLARPRHIPVVDLASYIRSIGQDPKSASFPHDGHWSPEGHLWAAQALNDYIRHHPTVCDRPDSAN